VVRSPACEGRAAVVLLLTLLIALADPGRCDEVTPQALLGEAAAAAARSRDPQARALCLAEIGATWAPLDESKYQDSIRQALECAGHTDGEMTHALSLRSIALRIARVDKEAALVVLGEALRVQEALTSSLERAVALREIVAVGYHLGLPDADARAAAALEVADKAEDPGARVGCLRDLGLELLRHNPDVSREALRRARKALDDFPGDDPTEPLHRAELAGVWALVDVDVATKLVERIEDGATRTVAVGMVARAVATQDPERALVIARGIGDEAERAHVVAVSAAAIPADMAATAATLGRMAVEMVAGVPGERAEATRAQAARAMARAAEQEAVELAKSITGEDMRGEALCGVAERVMEHDATLAATLLGEVDDPVLTDPLVARICVHLAGSDPQAAASLARTVVGRTQRVQALTGIAGVLIAARLAEAQTP